MRESETTPQTYEETKKPRREKNDRQRRAAASNIFCAR